MNKSYISNKLDWYVNVYCMKVKITFVCKTKKYKTDQTFLANSNGVVMVLLKILTKKKLGK